MATSSAAQPVRQSPSSGLEVVHHSARRPAGKAPLFLLHGWGNSHVCWAALVADLAEDRDLFLLDLPGFGANSKCSLLDLDAALEQIARLLPASCILVGWSLGGNLALRLAARYGHKVAAVVTLASNNSFVAHPDWPQAMAAATFDSFRQQFCENPAATLTRFCGLQAQGDQAARQLIKILRQQCAPPQLEQLTQWQGALDWLAQLDHSGELHALTMPLLHMFGDSDALVPLEAAEAMAAASPGEVKVLNGAGHAFLLSQPDEVARHLRAFLARVDPPAAAPRLNKRRIAQSFSRAAATYDSAAHLQIQVGKRLLSLMPEVQADEKLLDLGCGTGFCTGALLTSGGHSVALDIAEGMLAKARQQVAGEVAWLCADAESLPFRPGVFGGTVSNLTIQWSENLPRLFADLARVTRPGGWLLFSTLGPATLQELRSAWRKVDRYTHVNTFVDATELRAALLGAGFEINLFTEELLIPRYRQIATLMRELKDLGAHNVDRRQNPGLTGPRQLRRLSEAYSHFQNADGTLPATYQVYLVLARKPLALSASASDKS